MIAVVVFRAIHQLKPVSALGLLLGLIPTVVGLWLTSPLSTVGAMADTTVQDKASTLQRLHQAPELLTVVNVWDVISARVVAAVEGTTALATASHSIAGPRRLRGRRRTSPST